VKLLRTLPTGRLLFLLTAVGASAIAVVTAAVAIAGSGGSVPRSESLAQALHGALTADKPSGVSARIQFTNGLVPGSSLAQGQVGSALLTGAAGRLWVTNDGRGRLELQSDAGDAQITWNGNQVNVYDASSNTVYRATLPARQESSTGTDTQKTPPTVSDIQDALNRLALHADVSGATPTDVAGEPAYSVRVGPQDHSSLLGNAELAWDAIRGVPLRVGIYAKGATSPVLELAVTDIHFGDVSDGDVSIAPPANATVIDLSPPSGHDSSSGAHSSSIEGLAAVQAAAGFPVSFPDSVAGRARTTVRLVGTGSDQQTALAVYGDNLGAIVVAERKAGDQGSSLLAPLPSVTAGAHSAKELATPLGTILEWRSGAVSTIVAGSVTPAVAESAAADLG
jgi:outer membrane lipoprotein-sorting protein